MSHGRAQNYKIYKICFKNFHCTHLIHNLGHDRNDKENIIQFQEVYITVSKVRKNICKNIRGRL